MSSLGKIQTVYTTSKRGKRERLGEWFMRSAQRSRSKRRGDSSYVPGSAAHETAPNHANGIAHEILEDGVESQPQRNTTADGRKLSPVAEEPEAGQVVVDPISAQRSGSDGVGNGRTMPETASSQDPTTISGDLTHGGSSENATGQPSGVDDARSGEGLSSPVVGTAASSRLDVNEPGGETDRPKINGMDAEGLSAGDDVLADITSLLQPKQRRDSTSSIHGLYAPTEISEAETANPFLDSDLHVIGRSEADDETARIMASSPLWIASDQAELQEIDEDKYWGPTRDIPEEKMVALLTRVVKNSHGTENANYKVVSKHCGSYNCAYILESDYTDRICVRVPACGFPDRWNDFDGKLLRETALGMRFIRNKTDLPIPRLIDYDITMDNEIEAPFIVMSFLSGRSIEEVWPQLEGEDFAVTDARRQAILQSLAKTMRLLEPTVFSRFGALLFEDSESVPSVGDTSRLTTDDIFVLKRRFKPVAFRSSLEDYVHAAKRELFRAHQYPEEEHDHLTKGLFMLWEMMLESFLQVVKLEQGEPNFVLMQSDFNPQNILVDDRGNVNGLIDWDCLQAIPRQVGWCSLPHWLKKDWEPEYVWPAPAGTKQILQPHEFDKYRKVYSQAIRTACPGKNDSRFTAKSHVYAALLSSGEHLDNVKRFVCNVLGDVLPRLGGTQDVFISQIGEHGYKKDQKEWLEMRLRDFFAPEACHTCQRPSADETSSADAADTD